MKTIWHNSEDIRFDISICGHPEDPCVDEIIMLDDDGIKWTFDNQADSLLQGIIDPAVIYCIAQEFALELYEEFMEGLVDLNKGREYGIS